MNLSPEAASDEKLISKIAGSLSGTAPSAVSHIRIIKRSVDARKPKIGRAHV